MLFKWKEILIGKIKKAFIVHLIIQQNIVASINGSSAKNITFIGDRQ